MSLPRSARSHGNRGAERLAVPVHDVRARQLADGDATRLPVEELPVEDLGASTVGPGRDTRADRSSGRERDSARALEVARRWRPRSQELVARLVQGTTSRYARTTLSLRQEPGRGALIQLDLTRRLEAVASRSARRRAARLAETSRSRFGTRADRAVGCALRAT